MNEQLKLTDQQKYGVIQDLMDQIYLPKSGPYPIVSEDALQGKIFQSNIYTYTIIGSQVPRKTQTNNLVQKVINSQQKDKQNEIIQQEIDMEKDTYEEKDNEIFRYFRANIRCFKCKKPGHHNFACLQKQYCMFCLNPDHQSDKCPQRTVCYQCYQYGHIINECQAPPGIFCQECKRKHNRICCFLTKGIEPIKQMFNTEYLYNHERIRCMNCFQFGHLYCNN